MNKDRHSLIGICTSISSVLVMFAAVNTAQAQDSSGRESVALSGGVQATVFATVPQGFEPDQATDQELLDYGFPSRPDASNAQALALWERAVHTTRVAADLVEQPGNYHRPLEAVQKTTNATALSGNWSAVVVDGKSADFDSVIGYWAVPNVASQAARTANAYSSMWVGLDGDGTTDLIQDGTLSNWVNDKAVYNAWVEVLPAAETIVAGLPVNPGDGIYASTEYKIVSGKKYAYFYMSNYNTLKSIAVSIAFPSTLKFTGQSAEWVVERTEVGGSFENPMPNYGLGFMSAAYASRTGSTALLPANAISASVGTTYSVSMYDAPTNKILSQPEEQGGDSIIFQWVAY